MFGLLFWHFGHYLRTEYYCYLTCLLQIMTPYTRPGTCGLAEVGEDPFLHAFGLAEGNDLRGSVLEGEDDCEVVGRWRASQFSDP